MGGCFNVKGVAVLWCGRRGKSAVFPDVFKRCEGLMLPLCGAGVGGSLCEPEILALTSPLEGSDSRFALVM